MLEFSTNSQVLQPFSEMLFGVVTHNGIPFWQASGRTFQVFADDPTGSGDGEAKGDEGKGDPPGKKPDGSSSGDGDDGEFDKDRALATIKKLREKEKLSLQQGKELEELRKKAKAQDDAEKSEAERLKEQLAEAQRKGDETARELQETRNRQAIEREAVKAGAADPDDVFRLLDQSEFERDDSGKLTNADELVKALLKAKPYLAGKSTSTSGVPSTPRSNGQPAGHDDKVKENRGKLVASGDYQPL